MNLCLCQLRCSQHTCEMLGRPWKDPGMKRDGSEAGEHRHGGWET